MYTEDTYFFKKYNLYLKFLIYIFKIYYINLILNIIINAVINYII